MSLTKHILKKDILHLRGYLIIWLVSISAGMITSTFNVSEMAGDVAKQSAVQAAFQLTLLIQLIIAALIIPVLIHSEPVSGNTSFWQTRPISRTDLLKSKGCFIGLFLILAPWMAEALVLATHHVPIAYIAMATPDILLKNLVPILIFTTVATLTRNFAFYALTIGIYIIAKITLSTGLFMFRQMGKIPTLPQLTGSGGYEVAAGLATVLVCTLIIIHQVKTRNTMRSFILLAIQLLATFWIQYFSPRDLTVSLDRPAQLPTETLEKIGLNLNTGNSFTAHDLSKINSDFPSNKSISGAFRYSGIPADCFGIVRGVNAIYESNGKRIAFDQNMPIPPNQYPINFNMDEVAALSEVISPFYVRRRGHGSAFGLLTLTNEEFIEIRPFPGTYNANVSLDIFRIQHLATIPLEAGNAYTDGSSRIVIESSLFEIDRCTVTLREQEMSLMLISTDRRLRKSQFAYFLVNKKNRDVLRIRTDRFKQAAVRKDKNIPKRKSLLNVERKVLHTSSSTPPSRHQLIDAEWMKDAQLMIVKTKWIADTIVKFTQTNVQLRAQESGPFTISFSSPRKQTPKKDIPKLPENPSREDAEQYVQQLDATLVFSMYDGASWALDGRKDPETALYAEIGSEYLDLLIPKNSEMRNRISNNYKIWALEKLAQPEHKQLILSHLKREPNLVQVIMKFDWEKDAKDTLITELQYRTNLPREWIEAVTNLNDPDTYPPLITYFTHCYDKTWVYGHIKNLPGIDLDSAVNQIWDVAKYEDPSKMECNSVIRMAMEHGKVDALYLAGQALKNGNDIVSWHINDIRKAIKIHVGKFETDDAFRKWVSDNQDNILFDLETKMFVVE